MDPFAPNAENVFAQAIALPPGARRDEFVTAQCAADPALRREVESLLRAHEEAGEFLNPSLKAGATNGIPSAQVSRQGTALMNAAAYAEAFLQNHRPADNARLEAFLQSLPEGIRREARERIEAGRRVRQWRSQPEPPAATLTETEPRLPGYRLDRRLGQGGLGTVYAAHDEKLNRRVAIKVLRRRADAQVRRRVLDEARHTAALE